MIRREVLAGAGVGFAVPALGCLDEEDNGERHADTATAADITHTTAEAAPALTFDTVGPGEHALAVHVTSPEEAAEAFTYDQLTDDARHAVESFVDETDFETAVLVYIETRAPSSCHSLQVQSLSGSTDGVLTGHVASHDTSADDEDCPAVEATPSLLVRVTAESTPPSRAELDVTDGWGETEEVSSVSV